jgi:hypothetical protein
MDNLSIGQIIKQKRKAIGLRQKDLAEKLQVTDKAISAYEQGRVSPSLETVKAMCDIFGCSLYDFIQSRHDDPNVINQATAIVNTNKQVIKKLDSLTPTQLLAVEAVIDEFLAANNH